MKNMEYIYGAEIQANIDALKDKKLADYVGEQFKSLYEEMLLGTLN